MLEGGLHHGLGTDSAVLGQDGLLQRAAVHPDPDGDTSQPAGVGHRLHPVLPADVPWVDAHLVRPGSDSLQCQLVIEVDVHYHWYRAVLLDLAHRPGGLHIGDGHPDDLTPGGGQLFDLVHRGLHVLGGGVGHGLDGDGGAPADGDAAHMDLFGHDYLPNSLPTSLRVTISIRHIRAARPARWT